MITKTLDVFWDVFGGSPVDKKLHFRLNPENDNFVDISECADFERYDSVKLCELKKLIRILDIETEDD